jgi:CheY-like chemotaxis protein
MTTILVVDDEELARFTVREILEEGGHSVLEASGADEALRLLGDGPVDVLVTDIIMPGKDGIALVAEVRRTHPGIKVVAISGGGRSTRLDFLTVAKAYGADQVLAKPFGGEQLLAAITACLKA